MVRFALRLVAVALAATAWMVAAPVWASAAVRSGAGTPESTATFPSLKHVAVTYDTAGAETLTVEFASPITDHFVIRHLVWKLSTDPTGNCAVWNGVTGATNLYIPTYPSDTSYFIVQTFGTTSDDRPLTAVWSDDNTVLTLSAVDPLLAHIGFRCSEVALTRASNLNYPQAVSVPLVGKPGVSTGDAGDLTTSSASVSGAVDPSGEVTAWHIDYGTTTAYSSTVPGAIIGPDGEATVVSASLSGLPPSTLVHYRVVASNNEGVVYGADRTFTTTTPPPPDEPATPPTPPAPPVEALPSPESASVCDGLETGYPFRTGQTSAARDPRTLASDPDAVAGDPSIRRACVSFDQRLGRLRLVMRFYDPLPAAWAHSTNGYPRNYSASWRVGARWSPQACGYGRGDARVNVQLQPNPAMPLAGMYLSNDQPSDSRSLHVPSATLSADRRELSLTMRDAALAARNYVCSEVRLVRDGRTQEILPPFKFSTPPRPLTRARALSSVRSVLHSRGFARRVLQRLKIRCLTRTTGYRCTFSSSFDDYRMTGTGTVAGVWSHVRYELAVRVRLLQCRNPRQSEPCSSRLRFTDKNRVHLPRGG